MQNSFFQDKKIAIVVDWLIDFGGAELVVKHLLELFPHADIYTSVCFMDHPMLAGHRVFTSYIQRIPFFRKKHKLAGIFRPFAFRRFDLSQYDIILCSSSAESKNVSLGKWRKKSNAKVFVYCHTPIRYYWSHYQEYLDMLEFGWLNPLARFFLPRMIHSLRKLDYDAAQKVDFFIANSETTRARIEKYYDRASVVIYPGIEIPEPISSERKSYYISVGRCIPYKKFNLLVDTFNKNKKNLILCTATDTALFRELRARSGSNIAWKFRVSNEEKNVLIASARGFLFPPEEDFGLVPVEALALGTPVIAYGKGGATESGIDGETGIFFSEQTEKSLDEALEKFEKMEWNREKIQARGKAFSKEIFQKNIENYIQKNA